MTTSDIDSLREAIRRGFSGEACLFLGAGASRYALGSDGQPLPTSRDLAKLLAAKCGITGEYTLDVISSHFQDKHGAAALLDLLRSALKVSSTLPSLDVLASIPWTRIWTTNYDDAYEICAKKQSKTIYSVTTTDDVRNAQGNRQAVVHINGYLPRMRDAMTRDFVLTTESYATQSFMNSDWASIFRHDLQSCRAFIFVGYSLADIDIARLVFDPSPIQNKIHFIDQEALDLVLTGKLAKFGTVHRIGVNGLSELIKKERSSWAEPVLAEEYTSFRRLEATTATQAPSDSDFYKLLLNGVAEPQFLAYQLLHPDEVTYAVLRDDEQKCVDHLQGKSPVALLTADFANGKSVAALSVGLRLAIRGFDVFTLERPGIDAERDIQKLCRRAKPFYLILENYSRHLPIVEIFCKMAPDSCGLILTERTETSELRIENLQRSIGSWKLRNFNLDSCSNAELTRLSQLLTLRGLWGERLSLPDAQKQRYLRDDCNRQLQSALIDVARSPVIRDKLKQILDQFESVPNGMRLLITLCLLVSAREPPRVDTVTELLDLSHTDFRKIASNPQTREIMIVNSGVASFRSSIMAKVILETMPNATMITDVLADCVLKADSAGRFDSYYWEIAKELSRFGNVERLLPDTGKRSALVNLYERIKTSQRIRNNPHFWLQYGIARLSLGERAITRGYFEQAYALARAMQNYDTYQIDNHMGRLLLLDAEDEPEPDKAYQLATDALSMLRKQLSRENRHYPFRVAWNLVGVVRRHQENWTPEQKAIVRAGANTILEAIDHAEADVARSVHVAGAIPRLREVIDRLEE